MSDLPVHQSARTPGRSSAWLWLAPLSLAAAAALYFVGRYGGRWAETDSSTFSYYIRLLLAEGRLVAAGEPVYANGYAFQAISAFVVAVSGLDVAVLQQLVYPFVAVLVVLPAWVLYRELTGSARGAAFATVLLLLQPEFLFVLLRSSHEKFTRVFMLLALYCLVRGFRLRHRPWLLAAHIGLFYLLAYAMIASNNLLANSFFAALALAGGLGWLLGRLRPHLRLAGSPFGERLLYVTLIALGLVYLFIFYLYEPAYHHLNLYEYFWLQLSTLFLDIESRRPALAYEQVAAAWTSLPVYFLVSLANWLILLISFGLWAGQGWCWLARREAPASAVSWLLWLLYAAFALQGAASVLVDASGALSANLQHRLFPTFSMVAVAVVGAALGRWRPRRFARQLGFGLGAAVLCLVGLSLLKATNEPLLSNKWTFYRNEELVALDWSSVHLRDAGLWTEYDERLAVAYATVRGRPEQIRLATAELQPWTRDILLTDVTRLRSLRLKQVLPPPSDALRVYDNGHAGLYHLRPRTPYQR